MCRCSLRIYGRGGGGELRLAVFSAARRKAREVCVHISKGGGMAREKRLAGSFGRLEPQKLGFSTLVTGCTLLILVYFLGFYKPYVNRLQISIIDLVAPGSSHTTPAFQDKLNSTRPGAESATNSPVEKEGKCGGPEEKLSRSDHCSKEGNKNFSLPIASPRQGNTHTESSAQSDLIAPADAGDDGGGAPQNPNPICDFSDWRTDVCQMTGDVRIHGNSSTVLLVNPHNKEANQSWRILPYARRGVGKVKELVVATTTDPGVLAPRPCTLNHSIPAVVFSAGGYIGNFFHDFSDVLVPLFLTSRRYGGEVQFLIANMQPWWVGKYRLILSQLSHYQVIDLDNDGEVRCFSEVTVGLRSHKELSVDPSRSPEGYSMGDFKGFLRASFSLKRERAIKVGEDRKTKPRLLIIARKWARTFTNTEKIAKAARRVGFEVVVAEMEVASNVSQFAAIVNSCDVMMGVHGAGLTNLLFLPADAVMIQVVPWGKLEGIARADYGEPAVDAGLRYLEYSIKEEESTLIHEYPRDHAVFKDPMSFHRQGWIPMMKIYLHKQNVELDVRRFRRVLVKAMKLLRS